MAENKQREQILAEHSVETIEEWRDYIRTCFDRDFQELECLIRDLQQFGADASPGSAILPASELPSIPPRRSGQRDRLTQQQQNSTNQNPSAIPDRLASLASSVTHRIRSADSP